MGNYYPGDLEDNEPRTNPWALICIIIAGVGLAVLAWWLWK